MNQEFVKKTKELIDHLKATCANNGLGNDGNEYKIIVQIFLYKYMNDKFAYEVKKNDARLAKAAKWEDEIASYSDAEYSRLLMKLGPDTPQLKPEHYLARLFSRQNDPDFAKIFDATLQEVGALNNEIFSVRTDEGTRVVLFDEISTFVAGSQQKRDAFCRALINPLINFSFEKMFGEKFDFFATIFEYLIKDYNKDGGGKYAEYYTPHAVAKIMAAILIDKPVANVTCYDPAAGSGTLLINLAHAIGEDKCTIYSQDISQKSNTMLRLNLILNNLVHSIQNAIQGNTLLEPYHKDGENLRKFDFVVSNPPFKMDFSDFRDSLDTKQNRERFFAGIPKVKPKDKNKMEIYLLFIQHIMHSLSPKGRAAVVVPTGFITATSGIEKAIRARLVEEKMLLGVVSMPSNIFATTGTNVSILFIDKKNIKGDIVLMDASKLGTTVKDAKNQKTLLSAEEEDRIIETFNKHKVVDDFTVVVSYDQIKEKNYSLSAGQYFDVKIEYVDISPEEFKTKMAGFTSNLESMFAESRKLEKEIQKQLAGLKHG